MESMYEQVLPKYIHARGKQFLSDFKREAMMKKSQEKKDAKFSLRQFENFASFKKRDAHCCLRGLLLKCGEAYLWNMHIVEELKKLCEAYSVKFRNKRNAIIGALLANIITEQ